MPPSVVFVKASCLSALSGLHRYRDINQEILNLWHLCDKSNCEAAISRWIDIQQDEPIDEVVKEKFANAVTAGINAVTSVEVAEVLRNTDVAIRDEVQSEIYKSRGIRDEKAVVDKVECDTHSRITERNVKLYTKDVDWPFEVDFPFIVRVIGRIDGMNESGEIVEVKNRQKRFFSTIPLYERVQVQVYMWMIGARTCQFVQALDGDTKTEVVEYDENFIKNTVWHALAESMTTLKALISGDNETEQHIFSGGNVPETYNSLHSC